MLDRNVLPSLPALHSAPPTPPLKNQSALDMAEEDAKALGLKNVHFHNPG
jgi:hypothetical protein